PAMRTQLQTQPCPFAAQIVTSSNPAATHHDDRHKPPSPGAPSRRLDLDLLLGGQCSGGFRQAHRQDAITETRLNLFVVDIGRQAEQALEAAPAALTDVIALAIVILALGLLA